MGIQDAVQQSRVVLEALRDARGLRLCQVAVADRRVERALYGIGHNRLQLGAADALAGGYLAQALPGLQLRRELSAGQMQTGGYRALDLRVILFQELVDDEVRLLVALAGAGLVRLQALLNRGGLCLRQFAILHHLVQHIRACAQLVLLQCRHRDIEALRQVLQVLLAVGVGCWRPRRVAAGSIAVGRGQQWAREKCAKSDSDEEQ